MSIIFAVGHYNSPILTHDCSYHMRTIFINKSLLISHPRRFYGATSDGSKILGLDPHTVQISPHKRNAKVNGQPTQVVNISEEYLRSVHTTNQEEVPLPRMDPSIALGFYCRTADELDHLQESMKQWKAANPKLPELFTFADTSPNYAGDMDDLLGGGMMDDSLMDENSDVSDEEDFVFL